MRRPTMIVLIASVLALPVAESKGCLKGAAVGGVVGHVAGHHALVGAAAGCVIEHHRESVKEKEAGRQIAEQANQNRVTATTASTPHQ